MNATMVLADTNVISYTMRGGRFAQLYEPHLKGKLIAISFITVGELYYGAEKARWGNDKRLRLETTLRNFLVIPYDHEIARAYGRIIADSERSGRRMGLGDAWIAACAVRHGLPLVTHNAKDFQGVEALQVISEPDNEKPLGR
jgi:predicted nucleic acid-binding protein